MSVVDVMSPDSLETRFAELRAEVRSWEHQLRTQAPLVTENQVLTERLANTIRALDTLRNDVNVRFHTLHDELSKDLAQEVAELQADMRDIVERRDKEIADIRKGVGDLGIAMQAMNRETRTELGADIVEIKQNQAAIGADKTNRRGQNLAAVVAFFGSIAVLLSVIIERLLS